jgi:hypothetical protein
MTKDGNNKKTRILTCDDKMVTNNDMVLKMNGQNIEELAST